MIDIIKVEDKDKNQNLQVVNDTVLSDLKDENDISFEGEKVKFHEIELLNTKEALKYLRKQNNLLLNKNKEKNENIVKEVSELLDNVEKK